MNKTQATKEMRERARWGHYTEGRMTAYMYCPRCRAEVSGYLPKYAATYASGRSYKDDMVNHLMEEH